MFHIIYRRIYLLYVEMDSLDTVRPEEAKHFNPIIALFNVCLIFISFSCVPPIDRTIFHNVEVVPRCDSAAGKTSMMQLCCHFRVTNRQWQTI